MTGLPKFWTEPTKIGHIFRKQSISKSWLPSPIFFKEKKLERFNQSSTPKNDVENKNFEIFEEVPHNFGKSDVDII